MEISLMRGDTRYFTLTISRGCDDSPYMLGEGDKGLFGIFCRGEPVCSCEFSASNQDAQGGIALALSAAQTEQLDPCKSYTYEAEIRTASGEVFTVCQGDCVVEEDYITPEIRGDGA